MQLQTFTGSSKTLVHIVKNLLLNIYKATLMKRSYKKTVSVNTLYLASKTYQV